MKTHHIALYPGDGIGPEVLDQTVRVLEYIQDHSDSFKLKMRRFPWGCDYHKRHGVVAPEDYLNTLHKFDAILLGALGDPRCLPDNITLQPLIHIRQRFDQYACVRPAKLFAGVQTGMVNSRPVDMVVIRENSEGEYVTCGGRFKQNSPEEHAIQIAVHTHKGIERILRFGFDLAMSRRRQLTMITKSNALSYGMVLWDEVLEKLRVEYPEVNVDRQHVDAAAMNFVRRPESFDVVVASNLFGDILSDVAGVVTGGLGLAPSANINPECKFPSLFEPVHGSAPDIAGKEIANPVAAILSAGMMLDWLGFRDISDVIREAVEMTLKHKETTPDLGGKLKSFEMTDRIIGRLAKDIVQYPGKNK